MNKRPNLIYILGDDHRADYMANMGHPIIKTPNLDYMAENGVLFTSGYCTSPACTPSRTCHYLGQWERRHGVNFNSKNSVSAEAWNNSFPMVLKGEGYYLGWVGKNHIPAGEGGYNSGYFENEVFDYWYGNHGHSAFYVKERNSIYANAKYDTQIEVFEEGVMNFLDPCDDFLSSCETPLPQRPSDQPFCLCVTFNLPHGCGTENMEMRPSDDEIYKSAYRDRFNDFPLPKTYISTWDIRKPKVPKYVYSGDYIPQYDYVRSPHTLHERQVRTAQTVSGVDRFIGHLIEKLKQMNLHDNTIIVFSTDHGLHHGEHGLGGKCFLYEEDLHIPMIIYNPMLPDDKKGQSRDEFAVVPDLAPTVLDMMDIPIPDTMQGRSLKPLILGETKEWRSEFFAEQLYDGQNYPKSECIRTKQWKYIRYFPRTENPDEADKLYKDTQDDYEHFLLASLDGIIKPIYEELYHLSEDKNEEHNLADDEKYCDIKKDLKERLCELAWEARINRQATLTLGI